MNKITDIAIIGAGASGLCAAKHCIANNFQATVFEQTTEVGGIWVYTDQVGKDNNGLDIHTSLYKDLRILFSKDIMGFPDLMIPEHRPESYIPAADIQEYLNLYVTEFNLRKHIKFEHYVLRISPFKETKWQVIVMNLANKNLERQIFDAVIICNGHYSEPITPKYDGNNIFLGRQIHSHDFRTTESMQDENVLVIGSGASGMDLTNLISKTANKVTLSHHREKIKSTFRDNVDFKPDVKKLIPSGAEFIDGTVDEYSVILYCTGYRTTFPFLNIDCNISVDENFVQPLYKHIININRPTMAIIGINFIFPAFRVFDLQVRFLMEYFSGRKSLPTTCEMNKDTEIEMQRCWNNGLRRKQAHMLGRDQRRYYEQLCQLTGIENLKPVITKIHLDCVQEFYEDVVNFRNYTYKIIDDETYERKKLQ